MPVTQSDTKSSASSRDLTSPARPGSNVLSRRLAAGFALVSLVALAMCVVLDVLLGAVETSVVTMQAEEQSIRDGLSLAAAVREQYIHQAHVLIERSDAHMAHYPRAVEAVQSKARSLRSRLPESEHWRIDEVVEDSRRLDAVFRSQLLPAIHRRDLEEVLRAQHDALQRLSGHAVSQADALARAAEAGMAAEHHRAMRSSRLGLALGASCMLLIVVLSVVYTRRLRQSFLTPLASLVAAAERFGRGEFGQPAGTVGEGELQAVADAFDRMVHELQLRERKLLDAERMAVVGQFAAGIAHELNNPIGVIRGYLKTMKPSQPPDMLRDELKILDEEAAACQRIGEDLLAFARPGQIQRAWFAIDELLRSTVQRFTDSGQAKGRPVLIKAAPAQVFADAGRLRQVLLNLLRNAVQAGPVDAPIEVEGALTKGGGHYDLTVSDQGPGVSESDKLRIFEPFFSTHDGGSGLGLAVCHGIITAHEGSIGAEARPERGTTFRVSLPIGPGQREVAT